MELNIVSLADLTANTMILFESVFESGRREARDSGLFKVSTIPDNSGDTRKFNQVDSEEFATKKGEGVAAGRQAVTLGYSKIGTLKRIGKDIGITHEMRKYNKYPEVIAALTGLGRLCPNRMDLDMTHRLTFGFATTYTDMDADSVDIALGDTLALFSAAHTLKQDAGTFRNALANNPAVSRAGLEAMEKQIVENSMNNYGEKKTMNFDVIWTSDNPETINLVRELLQSTASISDNKNSGVTNVYQGKYRHVVLPYLATDKDGSVDAAKATYWGLASSQNSQAHLAVSEEPYLKSYTDTPSGEDFNKDTYEFGTRAGYFVCVVTGEWIHGSKGDGTA